MKVLLTGGSGNLGRTLVPRLIDRGDTRSFSSFARRAHSQEGAVFIKGPFSTG